jgi:hypothetical protein
MRISEIANRSDFVAARNCATEDQESKLKIHRTPPHLPGKIGTASETKGGNPDLTPQIKNPTISTKHCRRDLMPGHAAIL